jgi:hypothetical protein
LVYKVGRRGEEEERGEPLLLLEKENIILFYFIWLEQK